MKIISCSTLCDINTKQQIYYDQYNKIISKVVCGNSAYGTERLLTFDLNRNQFIPSENINIKQRIDNRYQIIHGGEVNIKRKSLMFCVSSSIDNSALIKMKSKKFPTHENIVSNLNWFGRSLQKWYRILLRDNDMFTCLVTAFF